MFIGRKKRKVSFLHAAALLQDGAVVLIEPKRIPPYLCFVSENCIACYPR